MLQILQGHNRRWRGFSEFHEFTRYVDIATSLPKVFTIYDTDNHDEHNDFLFCTRKFISASEARTYRGVAVT